MLTWPYNELAGSSFSSPIAAAAAALLWQSRPIAGNVEIEKILADEVVSQLGVPPVIDSRNSESITPVNAYAAVILARNTKRGDANKSGSVEVSDQFYLSNHIYSGGPPPQRFIGGNANCDLQISAADISAINNYLFGGGPAPDSYCPGL